MRAFLRHPSDISIECGAADGELVRGQPAKDVGAGGLCFRSSYGCDAGERVAVRIPACDPPFEAVGTVVWCRPSGGCYEVGVRFEGWNVRFSQSPDGGVLWKSPVPARGFNSPIVWSNRVFISGGDAQRREVFCYNATDGMLLWQRAVENVPGSPVTPPDVPELAGAAAPTMACDGRRVFVIFSNGDLAAVTLEGAPVWSKHLGVPKNTYGYTASLAVWPGRLIVQWEQEEGAPGGSKLLAFDGATGRLLWQRNKPTHDSWASPIMPIEAAGKPQVITLALPLVMSHSLIDGNELWRAGGCSDIYCEAAISSQFKRYHKTFNIR